MTYPRAGRRHRVRAQARRRACYAGRGGELTGRRRRCRAGGGRQVRHRRDRAAQRGRRQARHAVQGRRASPCRPAGRRPIAAWAAGRLERVSLPARLGRPGAAACAQRRLHRDVEFGLDGLRHRPGADHGRGRGARRYGTDELKQTYLPKLVSGEWMGTMQLTEPQAGSDVGALRTKAERAADGTYRITGQKIFITYGEHDLTDNIIHFVLARLPDAPPGNKGISLFLVPKFLVERRRLARRAQRRARAFDRAQARHPRLADLHDGLRRQWRRGRLPGRRGEPRPRLHVHHDEPRAARGRPAGRRHRRARDAAGASPTRASASRAAQARRSARSSSTRT